MTDIVKRRPKILVRCERELRKLRNKLKLLEKSPFASYKRVDVKTKIASAEKKVNNLRGKWKRGEHLPYIG